VLLIVVGNTLRQGRFALTMGAKGTEGQARLAPSSVPTEFVIVITTSCLGSLLPVFINFIVSSGIVKTISSTTSSSVRGTSRTATNAPFVAIKNLSLPQTSTRTPPFLDAAADAAAYEIAIKSDLRNVILPFIFITPVSCCCC